MKKNGLLNPYIVEEVAALGHTEYLCVADCGLPIPKGMRVIDVSVTAGTPTFLDVLKAVAGELVVEGFLMASEIQGKNPALLEQVADILGPNAPGTLVKHEEFKKKVAEAKCVIRTGETSAYANVLLVGGVNF